MILEATFTDDSTDRAALIYRAGADLNSYRTVFFGRLEGTEFVPSYSKKSRHYNSENRAKRAADGWCFAGK